TDETVKIDTRRFNSDPIAKVKAPTVHWTGNRDACLCDAIISDVDRGPRVCGIDEEIVARTIDPSPRTFGDAGNDGFDSFRDIVRNRTDGDISNVGPGRDGYCQRQRFVIVTRGGATRVTNVDRQWINGGPGP